MRNRPLCRIWTHLDYIVSTKDNFLCPKRGTTHMLCYVSNLKQTFFFFWSAFWIGFLSAHYVLSVLFLMCYEVDFRIKTIFSCKNIILICYLSYEICMAANFFEIGNNLKYVDVRFQKYYSEILVRNRSILKKLMFLKNTILKCALKETHRNLYSEKTNFSFYYRIFSGIPGYFRVFQGTLDIICFFGG